jgi:glycogen(starch) synthase
MHVLVTADTLGGVWTYTQELVTGLVQHGEQVTLVSFGELPTSEQTSWMEGLEIDYRPTTFRLEWMQEARRDVERSFRFLETLIREVKPDLLHFSQYCYGSLDVELPRIVVGHSDVVSWWAAVHGYQPPSNRWVRWYRDVVGRGIQQASFVVAPSRWMLEQLRTHYGPFEHSAVIYNGRDPRLFNPTSNKTVQVLAVGRLWDCAKQVSLLTRRQHGVPICIVGSGTHPEETFRGRAPLNGRSCVRFLPAQPEQQIRSIYATGAIYAATSSYEPFGLAPLEAALSRCALVANDIPTFHELWGDAAVYFRHNDPDSLADVIQQLGEDQELCRSHAQRVYERALERFTAERMLKDYLQLYGSLVRAEVAAA